MRIWSPADEDYSQIFSFLSRRTLPSAQLQQQVAQILLEVKQRGNLALVDFAKRFDQVELSSDKLAVSRQELAAAQATLTPEVSEALEAARVNVAAFAKAGEPQSFSLQNQQGVNTGVRYSALKRVGIYVPGGSAPLISTVIMSVEIARVAGCKEIVVCTPPGKEGEIHPTLLAALYRCGATEVIRAGGAQAIAAMAYGTETIRPVQKIFGPGNSFVVEAKRQLFGAVAIDLLPGPSEVIVLTDETALAEPVSKWIAADLLAQAEHGPDSVVGCISTSRKVLEKVAEAIPVLAEECSRQQQLMAVLEQGLFLVEVADLKTGVDLVNEFAPEHLSLIVADAEEKIPCFDSVGEIFVGAHTPVALGDYLAGPSHTLPTGGAGKSFSGLSITDFYRKTGIVSADPSSIQKSAPLIATIALQEGLDAHAESALCRQNN